MLKQLFSAAFNVADSSSLIKAIIFYLIVGVVGGVICKIVGIIPIIGWLVAGALGLAVGLFVLIGLILSILTYLNVRK